MSVLPMMFVWLDKRVGHLPGGNELIRSKFRKLLVPIRQFDRPTSCCDHIELCLKDKHVFFLTSNAFVDDLFLKQIASIGHIHRIYIYDQEGTHYENNDENLNEKMGLKRIIQFDERLYEQIVIDLIDLYCSKSDRLGETRDAKDLIENARKLLDTIDEKDQDLQEMEKHLESRLSHFSAH